MAEGNRYLTASIGGVIPQDRTTTTTTSVPTGVSGTGTTILTPLVTNATTVDDPGLFVSAGAGYRLPAGFRVQAEFSYMRFATDHLDITQQLGAGAPVSGRLNAASGGMHNRYLGTLETFYDLPLAGPLTPYVGLGVGVFHGDASDVIVVDGLGGHHSLRGGSATGAQVMAEFGLSYALAPGWSLGPAYRYVHEFAAGSGPAENLHVFSIVGRHTF